MLYLRILEKILNERDTKAELVRICESTIQDIRALLNEHPPSDKANNNDYNNAEDNTKGGEKSVLLDEQNHQQNNVGIQVDSEKYFLPLQIACQVKDCGPKVIILALDSIQKLLAHGHLTGNYPNSSNPYKRLIDTIVETICSCFNGAETDEGVELQIIKALLTIVTSQYVQIHEGTVLLVLRTCFNIYLLTKNPINQTTSRAMLTQMLQSTFTRMEHAYEGLPRESLSKVDRNMNITPERLDEVTALLENWDRESINWFKQLDLSSFFYNADIYQTTLLSSCTQQGELGNEPNESASSNGESTTVIENNEQMGDKNENGFISQLNDNEGISGQIGKSPSMCYDTPSILQKDAFLVFWAVCKFASKSSTAAIEGLDLEMRKSMESKSIILAFQLIKSVLKNCGPIFTSSSMFATAVRQHLCTVLKETGVSPIQEIYQLNLDLVILLIAKLQSALGDETQKLLQEILFPVLEKPTSFPFDHKPLTLPLTLALGTINRIYNNFKSLGDLFTSQETEENGAFQRMIHYTCQYTYTEKNTVDSGSIPELLPIRMLAIESIASLLHNMTQCLNKKKNDRHSSQTTTENEVGLQKLQPSLEQDLKHEDSSSTSVGEQEEKLENPAHSFVSTLLAFLQNLSQSVDNVLELDTMIQTISQGFYENGNFSDNLESSDAFYALMYSSISLICELSSKQGKRRVSKEWFVKSNQSTTNMWYQSLSDEFLELVYEEIDEYLKHQVVKHRKQHRQTVQSSSSSQPFNNVMHNAKKLVSILALHQSAVFYEKQVRCLRKMFKVMGKQVLNALIGTLIFFDDNVEVTDLCLTALQNAIHISAVLNLKNDRDAFVQALSRLSLAALKEIKDKTSNSTLVVTSKTSSTTTTENGVTKTTITTTTETKCRNVDIILTLLNVALNEGNHLQTTWLEILKSVSSLEASDLMRRGGSSSNSGTASPNQSIDNNKNKNEVKSWYAWAGSLVPSFWESSGKLDIESVKQSMDTSVNRVFRNSTLLDENGIVEFFRALCQVSLIEITHPENPRSFVYEKIFEVVHINIPHRTCLQWCSIWQVLSDFFSHLACSSDEDVSFFAIDSITKLVVHLLEKETLRSFRFQSHFLKPYETVMQNTPFISTREYVLGAIAKIVRTCAAQLRSGWISVFRILESSVFHDSVSTAEVSFTMLKNILDMFTETEVNLQSSYHELLKCLSELSFKGPTHLIQTESLQMMQKLAFLVHNKPELFLASESSTIQQTQLWKYGWFPIFKELASVVVESEKYGFTYANQAKALTIMFDHVKQYGESFHASWWQSLFGILFSIFHKLKFHGEDAILAQESSMKLSKGYNQFYCYYYIQFAIIDTFIRHYDILGDMLMGKVLTELEWCIRQGHDQIALSGVQCLHQLIRMLQNRMSTTEWGLITKLLQDLLQHQNNKDSNPVVQLELLKVVKTILIPPIADTTTTQDSKKVHEDDESLNNKSENQSHHLYPCAAAAESTKDLRNSVGDDNLFLLLDTIETRISWIVTTHQHERDRKNIEENSTKMESPDLYQIQLQETLLMDTYLRFLVQMYFHQEWPNDEIGKIVETQFVNGIRKVLQCFVIIQPIVPNHLHDLEEVMTTCIQSLHLKVSPEKFVTFASILYPNLCDLLELELDPKLSTVLAKYFLTMISLKIGET